MQSRWEQRTRIKFPAKIAGKDYSDVYSLCQEKIKRNNSHRVLCMYLNLERTLRRTISISPNAALFLPKVGRKHFQYAIAHD
jgi:hypothetical protein